MLAEVTRSIAETELEPIVTSYNQAHMLNIFLSLIRSLFVISNIELIFLSYIRACIIQLHIFPTEKIDILEEIGMMGMGIITDISYQSRSKRSAKDVLQLMTDKNK